MPTHFDDAESGESLAIETHVHLLSDHVAAGRAAGLDLVELHERVVDGPGFFRATAQAQCQLLADTHPVFAGGGASGETR